MPCCSGRGVRSRAMGWGFVWLMLVLKIPIAMLLYIVWWAIKQSDAEEPAPRSARVAPARRCIRTARSRARRAAARMATRSRPRPRACARVVAKAREHQP